MRPVTKQLLDDLFVEPPKYCAYCGQLLNGNMCVEVNRNIYCYECNSYLDDWAHDELDEMNEHVRNHLLDFLGVIEDAD